MTHSGKPVRRGKGRFLFVSVGFVNTMCAFLFVTLDSSIFFTGYMVISAPFGRVCSAAEAAHCAQGPFRRLLPGRDVNIHLFINVSHMLHKLGTLRNNDGAGRRNKPCAAPFSADIRCGRRKERGIVRNSAGHVPGRERGRRPDAFVPSPAERGSMGGTGEGGNAGRREQGKRCVSSMERRPSAAERPVFPAGDRQEERRGKNRGGEKKFLACVARKAVRNMGKSHRKIHHRAMGCTRWDRGPGIKFFTRKRLHKQVVSWLYTRWAMLPFLTFFCFSLMTRRLL